MPIGVDLLPLALLRSQRVLRVQIITARCSMAALGLVDVFLRREDYAKIATVCIVPNRVRHSKLLVGHVCTLHQLVHLEVRHLIIHNV